MPKHPQLQEAREEMATKKLQSCLFPPPATLLPVPWGGAEPCPGPAVPTRAWDTLGPSLCRVETYARTHQPLLFSALTEPNNLPEANFSHDAGQEAWELHLPAPGRAGSSTRT